MPAPDNALEAERYSACLAQVEENPEAGFERARDWRIAGGGIPSRHCAAMALIAMQKFATAAQMLEQNLIAKKSAVVPSPEPGMQARYEQARHELFDQLQAGANITRTVPAL